MKMVRTPAPCPRSRVISCHFQQGRPSHNQIRMFHMHKNRPKQDQPRSHLVRLNWSSLHQSCSEGATRYSRRDLSRVRIKALCLSVLSACLLQSCGGRLGSNEFGLEARDCVSLCQYLEYCTGCDDDGCYLTRCTVTE